MPGPRACGFFRFALGLIATLLLAVPVEAVAAPAPPTEAASKVLAGLEWMAGCWSGNADGTEMVECWTAPAGGILLGMHRDVSPSGRPFFEFLRIAAEGDSVIYWASPKGAPPTPFVLAEHSSERLKERVVFANPAHDFPQRIIYWRDNTETLRARVEGPQGGADRNEEWSWRLNCRATTAAPKSVN